MMRLRSMLALTAGFAGGYLVGTSHGRPAYERISSTARSMASELGLLDAGQRLKERGDDLAKASADLATAATRGAVDTAADRVEQQLADTKTRLQGASSQNGQSRV